MRRSPAGLGVRMAQVAAVGMILGGVFDLSLRRLLSHHEAYLGVAAGGAPPETEALVLLMLNVLGVALASVGALALALLALWHRRGIAWAGWAAATGIAAASGLNAVAILQVGSLFFIGPALFPLLAMGGVALAERGRSQVES
jgi:hypothetical protein